MNRMIEKINTVLRYQKNFEWQRIYNYKGYRNSFEYHVKHHPIDERYTGKWNSLIDYANDKTVADSYYKTSVELAQKFALISSGKYDVQYIKEHESINMVNETNGLIVCLKFEENRICFDIATCFFPSKLNMLFSIRNKVFATNNKIDQNGTTNNLNYMMRTINNKHDKENIDIFKDAMIDLFGSNSVEYRILFENQKNNTDDIINNIVDDTEEYLNLMESLIQKEADKKYYFVFNDGIQYIAKLSLLYKLKDKNYEKLYQRFLNIDINDSYKNALDECKEYIDGGE